MKNLNLKNSVFLLIFIFMAIQGYAQKQLNLQSPDKKIEVQIRIGNTIEYTILHDKDIMLTWSPISLSLTDETSYGVNSKLSGTSTKLVNETIISPIYKKSEIVNHYNELLLKFNNEFNLIFRAYDDGVAYRFVSTSKKPFQIKDEQVELNFLQDNKVYVPYVQHKRNSLDEQFYNSFENTYEHINLSQWDKERLAFLPIVIEGVKGKKIAVTEADLLNYPGMYLHNGSAKTSLKGVFAPYPKETKQGGHNMLQDEVQSREAYIAKFDNGEEFPWRAFVISEHDYQLANNDMVYKLASSVPKDLDLDWVKPGKVAWDWWNDWNLYDVDFKTGINNQTYKYYIDFASQHGVEYVILDEGWAVNLQADLMQVVPEINLAELIAYAKERNVGLILWAGYYALNKDIEGLCKHYSEMGIRGFKVDFMDRDDQAMVAFHTKCAGIAARYKMLLDYHGSYKPTGLHKTYPNVINFEGVHGLEQMKWSSTDVDQVTYDVTMPYIRMLAGPVDYTQGAMRNATRGNYRPVNSEAMSQGTRCRQLAQYVIFESPLNMLCDSPSNYMKEAECTAFISEIPTVWDQTIALDGEIGKYISIARKKNNIWYVGAMTNWDARTIELDLSFLGDGGYQAEIYKDGINADKAARDYVKETTTIGENKKLTLNMSPGGGFAIKITKQ